MSLTIEDVRAYGDSIDRIERKALEMLMDGLGKLDSSDISAYIDAAVALTNAMCGSSAMAAAELAAAYYDTIREMQVGSKLGAEAIDLHVPEATEKAIRPVQVDGNLLAASDVRSRCGDRLSYEVKRAAGETVRRNAARDPMKPRYARVPSGIDTCKFCLELASRTSKDGSGAYWSARSAGKWDHYHPSCRCRVIPMFKGGVDGFDPDKYHDMWKHPERFPELIEARKAKRREKYERERIRKRINESAELTMHPERGITSKRIASLDAKVDWDVVNSSGFKDKFKGITDDQAVNSELLKRAKAMLTHCDGRKYEDSYVVSAIDGKTKGKSFGGNRELEANISKGMVDAIISEPPGTLIGIHNHPSNIPPTGSDIAAAAERGYRSGVVVTHSGQVYVYEVFEHIPSLAVDLRIKRYTQKGMSDTIAGEKVLDELQDRGVVRWRKM